MIYVYERKENNMTVIKTEKIKFEDLQVGEDVLLEGFGCTSDEGYEVHKFTVSCIDEGCVTLKNEDQSITVSKEGIEYGLISLYKEGKGTTTFEETLSVFLETLISRTKPKKEQDIEQTLRSLSLPPSFLSPYGCCAQDQDEFNFKFTQDEVNTITAILGFFNPKEGDEVYNLQEKLSEASEEPVVESMFDLVELVNEDGTSISAPLFGSEGYFLNEQAMNLKFNK